VSFGFDEKQEPQAQTKVAIAACLWCIERVTSPRLLRKGCPSTQYYVNNHD
jgi:hypothetical protein